MTASKKRKAKQEQPDRAAPPPLRVLVTGATGGQGALLVKRLARSGRVTEIIGLSNDDASDRLLDELGPKFRFIRADTRKQRTMEEVFQQHRDLDALIHLAYDNVPDHSHERQQETNVFGTLRLLQLARQYGVARFIYKSTAAVYGFNPDNPCLIQEDYPMRGNRDNPILRDRIEADLMCQLFSSDERPPRVVVMRFCSIFGQHVRSPVTTMLKLPAVPLVLGFNPMFQIIHEDDVTEALFLAVTREANGIYNVAGRVTEPLSEVIRRLKHVTIPLPEFIIERAYPQVYELNQTHSFPFDIDFLKYSFAVDTARVREELGFEPRLL